jgi:DNA-binding HxlR family transcriptional regulator
MSPSVLYERLKELSVAGLIDQTEDQRYRLTALGRSLIDAIEPLNRWSERWAAQAASWS